MPFTLTGPCETLVSAIHGNAVFSDGEYPVTIAHYSNGAVITPSSTPETRRELESGESPIVGKLHCILPTLRTPEEETPDGILTGHAIASTALHICLSSPIAKEASNNSSSGPPAFRHSQAKITSVGLYGGRELLGSWGRGEGRELDHTFPADSDFQIPVECDIYGRSGRLLNDAPNGLGVTLTIEFGMNSPALLLSSVSLIQIVGNRKLMRH
ncbi:hypothetical protein ALT_2703 [Aspergillus lentulus]|uniref:Uncharacterized protein n=1 Tax=Aspergillus lentulus TaxID=293939 RepID=A0AAN4PFA1_ASPLE|nr:hypothetical protein ALT_2703 [Aspergillus lentulus]